MTTIIDSTLQLAKEFPKAFAVLPKPYQADDVLIFTVYRYKSTGALLSIAAEPKPDQISILGDWVLWWYPDNDEWLGPIE
jgi:hypothetical protein